MRSLFDLQRFLSASRDLAVFHARLGLPDPEVELCAVLGVPFAGDAAAGGLGSAARAGFGASQAMQQPVGAVLWQCGHYDVEPAGQAAPDVFGAGQCRRVFWEWDLSQLRGLQQIRRDHLNLSQGLWICRELLSDGVRLRGRLAGHRNRRGLALAEAPSAALQPHSEPLQRAHGAGHSLGQGASRVPGKILCHLRDVRDLYHILSYKICDTCKIEDRIHYIRNMMQYSYVISL